MIPLPGAIGVIGLTLVALEGALFGLIIGFLGKRVRDSGWPGYGINVAASMTGFVLGAHWHFVASLHAVEVNGQVIGWNSGGTWLGLRHWLLQHMLAAQIIIASALMLALWLLNLLRMRRSAGSLPLES